MSEPITVKDLDALVEQIFQKKKEIADAEEVTSNLNKELMALKEKSVLYLNELDRNDYRSEVGTISILQRWRVGLPKTEEAKSDFYNYLKVKGLFDSMITVNSNSLNSLFMSEWKAAQERGEGMEFKMPGIEEPKLFEDLSIRKR